MSHVHQPIVRFAFVSLTLAACACLVPLETYAQEGTLRTGRVEFDFADAPPANVAVDLKDEMLLALTDIAKAAVEGVVEGLMESSENEAVQQSAHHLHAVREILGLATEAIQEVRVRVYEDLADDDSQASMVKYYHQKVAQGKGWQNVVRVRDGDEDVAVCIQQDQSAIRGVFVIVSDGNDLVLANVVGELTPDRVKNLTNQAVKVGMQFGLEHVIEDAMRGMPRASVASKR